MEESWGPRLLDRLRKELFPGELTAPETVLSPPHTILLCPPSPSGIFMQNNKPSKEYRKGYVEIEKGSLS